MGHKMASEREIIAKLVNFIESISSSNNRRNLFYIGITDNIERRAKEHNFNLEDKGFCIFAKCNSSDVARGIEGYVKTKWNTDGDSGGGNDDSCYVYVYRKNGDTKP